jgi:UDP-N-acetylmuramoyl-L-alanyl-D-glutamate--2,6-diaminopimelate ligase
MMLADMMQRAGLPGQSLPAVPITGITADSRHVSKGYLFAALPGAVSDGRHFIAAAVASGAAAVLAPLGTEWPPGVPPRPLILNPEPRRALALLAAAQEGAQPDHIVAVTGTNGKTSSVDFLRQFWQLAGLHAGSLGTLGLIAPGHEGGSGLTTPDPVALAGMLAELAREGVGHLAMEASSHGLDQFRLDGVRLSAAGFSNLTRDHMDYHGTLDAYRAAKMRLFADLLPAGAPMAANADMDPGTLDCLRAIAARRRLDMHTVGVNGNDIRLLGTKALPHGQILHVMEGGSRPTMFCWPRRWRWFPAWTIRGRWPPACAACAGAWNLWRGWKMVPRPMSITRTRQTRWNGCCKRYGHIPKIACCACSVPVATAMQASAH